MAEKPVGVMRRTVGRRRHLFDPAAAGLLQDRRSKIQQSGIPRLDQFDPTKYQFGIYGIIIVLMMLFRPAGLIPERRHKVEMIEGVHDTPLYDVEHHDRDTFDD